MILSAVAAANTAVHHPHADDAEDALAPPRPFGRNAKTCDVPDVVAISIMFRHRVRVAAR